MYGIVFADTTNEFLIDELMAIAIIVGLSVCFICVYFAIRKRQKRPYWSETKSDGFSPSYIPPQQTMPREESSFVTEEVVVSEEFRQSIKGYLNLTQEGIYLTEKEDISGPIPRAMFSHRDISPPSPGEQIVYETELVKANYRNSDEWYPQESLFVTNKRVVHSIGVPPGSARMSETRLSEITSVDLVEPPLEPDTSGGMSSRELRLLGELFGKNECSVVLTVRGSLQKRFSSRSSRQAQAIISAIRDAMGHFSS